MTDTYRDKLRDPRWQKKRLEIFQRDAWTCQACGDKETELQVHHLAYSGEPWEAQNDMLRTLCAPCHKLVTEINRDAEHDLIQAFHAIGLHPEGFSALAEALHAHRDFFWHFGLDYPDRAVLFTKILFTLLPEQARDVWPLLTNALAEMPRERVDPLKPFFLAVTR